MHTLSVYEILLLQKNTKKTSLWEEIWVEFGRRANEPRGENGDHVKLTCGNVFI